MADLIGIGLLGVGVGLVLRVPGLLAITAAFVLLMLAKGMIDGTSMSTTFYDILRLGIALQFGYLIGLAISGYFNPRK